MKKKNYLIEKLSKEEKAYIKRTVMTARNIYFRDNYDDINNTTMLLNDETAIEEESVLEKVLNRCQEEIESAVQFENVMSDPKLYNIVKELSLKEKEVLFYLYKKQKTMNETAQIMNLTRKTLRKYRNEAQKNNRKISKWRQIVMFNDFSLTDQEILKIIDDYQNLITKYSMVDGKINEDIEQEIKLFIFKMLSKNRKK